MENKFIAYCGLDCEKCEARLATINNDNNLRIKVAREWSGHNGVLITPEQINCVGCRIDGVKSLFCESICPIRKCAKEKLNSHCGICKSFKTCEKLKMITDNNNEVLNRLKK